MKKLTVLAALFVIAAAILACGSFGPPPSCGDNIGGTADTAKFDQYFTSMMLVSQASGQPGPEGENGAQFSAGDPLVILMDSKSDVAVRACIQPMSGGDSISFDQTQNFTQGAGTFTIGAFEQGVYVIRVIVDGILVKNFPFAVK